MEERDFKGVWIDKEIWLDTRLNALDKIILVEIDSLDCGNKGCYASNKYLAEFCQCSQTKISNTITKLVNLGYIVVENFDGRSRKIKSRITKNVNEPYKNCKSDLQNQQTSNIYNNINNNSKNNILDKSKILQKNSQPKSNSRKTKKDKCIDMIVSKMEEYTFTDKVKERILDFYSDRMEKNDYPATNQITVLMDTLSKVDEKEQLGLLDKSIMHGYRGVFLEDNKPFKKKSGINLKDDYSNEPELEEQLFSF